MSFELWVLYLFAAIGLSLTPGPNGLLVLTHGAIYGVRRSVYTILGGVLGFTILMAASMAGMGALLMASHQAFLIAKYIGAAYLVYLGIKTWRAPPPQVDLENRHHIAANTARKDLFSQGVFVAVSNPKALIFFAAFLPQFMTTESSVFIQFLIMAGTFAATEFLYELIVAGSADKFAPWLSQGRVGKWFNRISGVTFVGIGGVLATVNRNA